MAVLAGSIGLVLAGCGVDVGGDTLSDADQHDAPAGLGPGAEPPTNTVPPLYRVPRNEAEVRARIAELREQYAPFLRVLPAPLDPRVRKTLPATWRTKVEVEDLSDGQPRPTAPDWHLADLDDSGWMPVTIPEWRFRQRAGAEHVPASPIFWYRVHFAADAPQPGQRLFLVFDGVDWEAEVFMNGQLLGSHKIYYEPFRFDVTAVVQQGTNVVAVRVLDGPRFGEPHAFWSILPDVTPRVAGTELRYVPDAAQSINGKWIGSMSIGSGGGIHRGVALEATAASLVLDAHVSLDPGLAQAEIDVETDSAGGETLTAEVHLLPENFDGASYEKAVEIALPGGRGRFTVTLDIPGARRWEPESPYLYRCRVVLKRGGTVLDAHDVLFGVRSFALSTRATRGDLSEGTPS
jgi:beta-galactosidase/beta-glucuronidase